MLDRVPTPAAALALFLFAFVLNVLVGSLLFQASTELGILLAEPLAVLVPTLIAVRLLGLDARRCLRLRRPAGGDLLLALPLAFSLTVLNDQLSNLTAQILPMDEEWVRQMTELLRAETAYDWLVRLAGIGLGAAVSEEVLFRGFLQTAFEHRLGRRPAIYATAALFAIMHVLPQGMPSYFLAGIVLGITAVATQSLLVPVLIHFTNNAAAVALLSLADMPTLGRPVWIPAGILVPAVLIFLLTLGHYVRKAAALPEPDRPPTPAPAAAPASVLVPEARAEAEEALARLPASRRRLGWALVAASVLFGGAIILGLFAYSVYLTDAQSVHARLLDELEEEVLGGLAPEIAALEPAVRREFEAVGEANEAGRLELGELARLTWLVSQAKADGTIDAEEADRILAELRRIAAPGRPVRRL